MIISILNLNLSLSQFIIIVYLLIINLVTFFIFALDKLKSTGTGRRISEKMLWFLALIGGSVGALLSMHFFRHKTKKLSFQAVLAVIIFLQVILIGLLFSKV